MTSVSGIVAPPQIERALRHASAATGTDFDYLLRTAQRESGMRSQAKSSTSSATGLFQFIEQTWFGTLKQSGHDHGLGAYADAITRSSDGRYNVADPALREEILALRRDPQTAALMAGEYTRAAGDTLQGELGRAPREGELYIAHFLGAEGATRFIKAAEQTPDVAADSLFPRAARANRPIFYERNGESRTISEVYNNLVAHHGSDVARFADDARPQVSPPQGIGAEASETPEVILASHFQRATQSAFNAAGDASTADMVWTQLGGDGARVAGGPLVIIPESVRAQAGIQPVSGNLGGISNFSAETSGNGPTEFGSRGLLRRFAPLYTLFHTA